MAVINVIGGILMILSCIGIMFLVALQESPKGNGVNSLTGGDSYFSKNQGRTMDAMLSRLTKVMGIVFFVVTLVLLFVNSHFGA